MCTLTASSSLRDVIVDWKIGVLFTLPIIPNLELATGDMTKPVDLNKWGLQTGVPKKGDITINHQQFPI